jgi:hypothetical protein
MGDWKRRAELRGEAKAYEEAIKYLTYNSKDEAMEALAFRYRATQLRLAHADRAKAIKGRKVH